MVRQASPDENVDLRPGTTAKASSRTLGPEVDYVAGRVPGGMKEGGRGGRATSPPAVASTDRSQCRQTDDTAIFAGLRRW